MEYYKTLFKIECCAENLSAATDLLTDIAAEAGYEAFEEEDDMLAAYVQVELLDEGLLAQLLTAFPMPDVVITYTTTRAENKNWNELWEEAGFEPVVVDESCIIYDARHTDAESLPKDIALKIGIETRQAFGTGTHQTTRMVLRCLLEMQLAGKSVVDCGCGTGILAIAASKMGAQRVTAYDIDEWSVENTLHNALLNNVNLIDVHRGDTSLLEKLGTQFDVVLANINRNILLADLPLFSRALNKNGIIVLSGFYEEDIALLTERANALQLEQTARLTEDGWACLVLERKNSL